MSHNIFADICTDYMTRVIKHTMSLWKQNTPSYENHGLLYHADLELPEPAVGITAGARVRERVLSDVEACDPVTTFLWCDEELASLPVSLRPRDSWREAKGPQN